MRCSGRFENIPAAFSVSTILAPQYVGPVGSVFGLMVAKQWRHCCVSPGKQAERWSSLCVGRAGDWQALEKPAQAQGGGTDLRSGNHGLN